MEPETVYSLLEPNLKLINQYPLTACILPRYAVQWYYKHKASRKDYKMEYTISYADSTRKIDREEALKLIARNYNNPQEVIDSLQKDQEIRLSPFSYILAQ